MNKYTDKYQDYIKKLECSKPDIYFYQRAIEYDATLLKYIPKKYQYGPICAQAVKNNPKMIKYVKNDTEYEYLCECYTYYVLYCKKS